MPEEVAPDGAGHSEHNRKHPQRLPVCDRDFPLANRGVANHSLPREREPLCEEIAFTQDSVADLLELDSALDRLAHIDRKMAQVVELRFFGGFTVAETAQVLDLSATTVKHDWMLAKAWLKSEMG